MTPDALAAMEAIDAADAVPMPMDEAEAALSHAVEHCDRHRCVSIGVDARALRTILAEVRRLTALAAQHDADVAEARRATREECAAECDAYAATCRDRIVRPPVSQHEELRASWAGAASGGEACAARLRALPDAPAKGGGR